MLTHAFISCAPVRLPAILPWFTFLFGLTSAGLAFAASRRHVAPHLYPVSSAGVDMSEQSEPSPIDEKKKVMASVEQREV